MVASLTTLDPSKSSDWRWFVISLTGYFAVNLAMGFIQSSTLQQKRIRIIPDLIDIIFVSLLVILSGPETSWFILYLFPIASAARYFGGGGSIFLALVAAVSYTVLYVYSGPTPALSFFDFTLRILSLVGIAAVSGNLAKSRHADEMKLIRVSEEVNNQILAEVETDRVFRYILKKALEFTGSEMGHIRLAKSKTPGVEYEVVTAIGHPDQYDWELRPYDDSFSRVVIKSGKA